MRIASLLQERLRAIRAAEGKTPIDVRILDLCTGSGCIAILLAHRLHQLSDTSYFDALRWQVIGTDISPVALNLAAQNARLMNLPTDSIHFHHADIFVDQEINPIFTLAFGRNSTPEADLPDPIQLNMVVSNPPYLTPSDYVSSSPADIDISVREWEDKRALVGVHPSHLDTQTSDHKDDSDKAGLAFYHRINALVARHANLLPQSATLPRLVLEVGHRGQAQQVATIFNGVLPPCSSDRSSPSIAAQIRKDAWGVDRVVEAY
ncbi:unnamed protein product [Tilletia caries]|nr:unnamed protein product [Tilletia caries]CAD6956862.1 unnamed protein product [Tilletia caries]CAD6983478.1 unnamed protein product [Tilletia controversa]